MTKTEIITLADHWKQAVSLFQSVTSLTPVQISLKKWIERCTQPKGVNALKCKSACEKVRATEDKELQKELKKGIPAISPGALMSCRDKEVPLEQRVIQVTGWMQFDIDLKENPHLTDSNHLRNELKKIVYVAFCSISVSGKGVWGLVKIKNNDMYKEHFEQLKIDFASRGIKLDPSKGGNSTDLRYYSYDPNAYIAEKFQIYDRMKKEEPVMLTKFIPTKKKSKKNAPVDTQSKVEELINEIRRRRVDIAPDYKAYLNVGFAFATEFGESGRNMFHSVCCISPKYKENDADGQYSACMGTGSKVNGKITIATFFYLCKQAGLEI